MSKRVLLFSPRKLRDEVFRSFDYEFEDFVAAIDEVDWYTPEYRHVSPGARNLAEGLSRKFLKVPWNPAYRMPAIQQDYEVFYVLCMYVWDLQIIARIPDWSGRVGKAVIYINELFLANIQDDARFLHVLSRFDRIETSYTGTLEALESVSGVTSVFYPSCIDALASAPDPRRDHRPIEVYSLGRGQKRLFNAFKELADHHYWTFIYSTHRVTSTGDYRGNRNRLKHALSRTVFLEVNPAKFDEAHLSENQHELGFRYFEGAGSGCVMVGPVLKNPHFKEVFPWEDAVVVLPEDDDELIPFFLDLRAQKDRLRTIMRANVHGALSRLDFAYRWEQTLRAVGMQPTNQILERREVLAKQAARFE